MKNLDLRQLRYFVAVAEELHFGRAAARLHMSQPPLSQQIAALEIDLNVKLFIRDKHKVAITTAGLQLLKDARNILQAAKEAAYHAQAAAAGQIGTLNIGLNYTSPLSQLLSTALYNFSKHYPKVGLELHENTSDQQIVGLNNSTLDICFIWPTRDDLSSSITLHPLSHDKLRLVMRNDHPLANKRTITIHDLREFQFFLSYRQTRMPFYDALIDNCTKAGFKPNIRTHIIQLPFILNTIVTGHGLALLPEFLLHIKPKRTLFRPCTFLPTKSCVMPLSLAHRANDLSPLVQNFVKAVTAS